MAAPAGVLRSSQQAYGSARDSPIFALRAPPVVHIQTPCAHALETNVSNALNCRSAEIERASPVTHRGRSLSVPTAGQVNDARAPLESLLSPPPPLSARFHVPPPSYVPRSTVALAAMTLLTVRRRLALAPRTSSSLAASRSPRPLRPRGCPRPTSLVRHVQAEFSPGYPQPFEWPDETEEGKWRAVWRDRELVEDWTEVKEGRSPRVRVNGGGCCPLYAFSLSGTPVFAPAKFRNPARKGLFRRNRSDRRIP
ncbi:hypothetical protein FB451DRAFT_1387501 [Mycena latifolia]|nr:hypothetical protein FB451DRAFT_1387501 [Mycena latifolia]